MKVIESITWRIQRDAAENPAAHRRATKTVIKCPKCSDFDRNKVEPIIFFILFFNALLFGQDVNNLKLHIFHHYLEFWAERVPVLASSETLCDQCCPQKKVVGANPEGCRTALICHRAIHHQELR